MGYQSSVDLSFCYIQIVFDGELSLPRGAGNYGSGLLSNARNAILYFTRRTGDASCDVVLHYVEDRLDIASERRGTRLYRV